MIDERITSSSIWVADSRLSSIYLKNDANYLWFILIPRVDNVQEIYQLNLKQRMGLMEEISEVSSLVNQFSMPDKLNIGALGNIVAQLHIHIIARFNNDKAWPHGVWQADYQAKPYETIQLQEIAALWRGHLQPLEILL